MTEKELDRLLEGVQKPGRYTGGELNAVVKEKTDGLLRFAFCFPDTYEIGMSHLGLKILYGLLNNMENVWCERVFAPWLDMEENMIKSGTPLFGLESRDPLTEFDFVGFTLQYELTYTNLIHMLRLGGIEPLSKDRGEDAPIVCAGGPCAYNCEPIADFLDMVFLGEGEEQLPKIMKLYEKCKKSGLSKKDFLKEAAKEEGVYIPSFYDVSYHEDGRIKAVTPKDYVPEKIRKVIISDLNSCYYPDKFVVPNIEVVHDRVMAEIFRGCIRGCRFCQAGIIYRPVRSKLPETVNRQTKAIQENTGYEEISLSSLSTSDYQSLEPLLDELLSWTPEKKVNLSLPSLRVDKFKSEILEKTKTVRKSGLTFAPEAGSQRLRDVINKNVTLEDIRKTARVAFSEGFTSMKLYFMIGLPTETQEDLESIKTLAYEILDCYYETPNRNKAKSPHVTVSASSFVPKPFTPFQWCAQNTPQELDEKQIFLKQDLRSRKLSFSWHTVSVSLLEGIFARGDRRLSKVLLEAEKRGCKFDGWDDQLKLSTYLDIMKEQSLEPAFYANRKRDEDEIFPWDHIDVGVSKEFLLDEYKRALDGETSPNCREACLGCGASDFAGGECL